MQKIIRLFQRNYDGDHLVRNEVVPGAEWVINGKGRATIKYDGTCCMVKYGKLFKRFAVKPGGKVPSNFEAATGVDPETDKQQGWVPVREDSTKDKWHREAFANEFKWDGKRHAKQDTWADGTYELVGPKVQGNPEGHNCHLLVVHGYATLIAFPRTFDEIKAAFVDPHWCHEGVVWHHPDGRMVKIKVRDFGFERNPVP